MRMFLFILNDFVEIIVKLHDKIPGVLFST